MCAQDSTGGDWERAESHQFRRGPSEREQRPTGRSSWFCGRHKTERFLSVAVPENQQIPVKTCPGDKARVISLCRLHVDDAELRQLLFSRPLGPDTLRIRARDNCHIPVCSPVSWGGRGQHRGTCPASSWRKAPPRTSPGPGRCRASEGTPQAASAHAQPAGHALRALSPAKFVRKYEVRRGPALEWAVWSQGFVLAFPSAPHQH